MSSDVAALVRPCTAQLWGRGGFLGSGFLVAPGVVVTCAHVVAAHDAGVTVVIQDKKLPGRVGPVLPASRAAGVDYWPFPDLALVEVDQAADLGCVWLADKSPDPGAVLAALGFSQDTPAGGVAPDSMRLTVVGESGPYLKVKDDLVARGLSGSPVLDETSGRVCGMVKASRDYQQAAGGWIIPVQVLADKLPGIGARNQAAHPPGSHWWALATRRRELTARLFGTPDPLAPDQVGGVGVPPSWWLDPRNQVVGFQPRPEVDDLYRWATAEHPQAPVVRLVCGPGGAGKTRLAVELGRRLESAGWIAGLVAEENPAALETVAQTLPGVIAAGHRVLIAVDYAEGRDVEVAGLLERLPLLGPGVVRVLLLARIAGGWWQGLRPGGPVKYRLDRTPLVLGDLATGQLASRQVLTNAVDDFARTLALADGKPPAGQRPRISEELLAEAEQYQDALNLHALALAAVLRWRQQPHKDLGLGGWADPLAELLGHERAYWRRAAGHLQLVRDHQVAAQVLLVPTLFGARDAEQARRAVGRVPEVAARFAGEADAAAKVLRALYPERDPRRGRWWAPLPLDRLGETLLVEVLAGFDGDREAARDYLVGLLAEGNVAQAEQALTVLGRVLCSFAGGR